MHRVLAITAATVAALALAGPAAGAANPGVAALQVALRAQGHYPAVVDGLDGPATRSGLTVFQRRAGLPTTGRVGPRTRAALGPLGQPLLGQRELATGATGWDVSSLEFRLIPFGLDRKAVDGRFTRQTAKALARFQTARGLRADGIAGKLTYRALASSGRATLAPRVATHVVAVGENLTAIAARYKSTPARLAKANQLRLADVIVPGQRLVLPAGAAEPAPAPAAPVPVTVPAAAVRASIDHWAAVYGVDPRLARATAWMESGFQQGVVSKAGAVGVMQLLPTTWAWVDSDLLGTTTPRTYDGNIRAGVRYLRWLLDEFGGDERLALAGYYQGPQAVRDRGLFDDTKRYIAAILGLHGGV